MTPSPSRLTALVFLLALVAAALSSCTAATPPTAVSVLGPWVGSGDDSEEAAFRKVLDEFTAKTGIPYDYEGTRALTQVLLSNVQAGTPPDVALLSSVGDLARYARDRQLFPLDDVLGEEQRQTYPFSWLLPQTVDKESHIFGVPVKVNLKSMIWRGTEAPGLTDVATWPELLAYSESLAQRGVVPWCMGLGDGPNSGWPATDFIEDILLSGFGEQTYQNWATGEVAWTSKEVTAAWNDWGRIATNDDFVRGGRNGAILTDFGDAGRSMFTGPRGCAMEHQASFIMNNYMANEYLDGGPRLEPGEDFGFVPFPPFTAESANSSPVIASADFAGMFDDTPQARELMRFLASDDAQRIWPAIRGSGAFTANARVSLEVYPDAVSREIGRTLREAPGVCLDATDVMPAMMRDAFHQAALDYVTDPTALPALLSQLDDVREDIPDDHWLDRLSCRT